MGGFEWTYTLWHDDADPPEVAAQPLYADDLLQVARGDAPEHLAPEGLVKYADTAYLSARLLMIASQQLHAEMLYHAGQVLEKYMKAIVLKAHGHAKGLKTHDLVTLSERVAEQHAEFGDQQFRKLCERLNPFQQAGRYPDHDLTRWRYPLEVLTFLDGFIVHCREILTMDPPADNPIRRLMLDTAEDNPVKAAGRRALAERNRFLRRLCDGPAS